VEKQQQCIYQPALWVERLDSAPLCWQARPEAREHQLYTLKHPDSRDICKGSRIRLRVPPKGIQFPGPTSLSAFDFYFIEFCIFKKIKVGKSREWQEANDDKMQKGKRDQVRERRATSSFQLLSQTRIFSDFTELYYFDALEFTSQKNIRKT